ncbi:hypothetical protein B0H10DRAFT_1950042 [Mycena sp. CBHHK59/15]|nr:hypothetical protein B0H10DRAFT_1950042 [Mycena sp. CBHHK59/15]
MLAQGMEYWVRKGKKFVWKRWAIWLVSSKEGREFDGQGTVTCQGMGLKEQWSRTVFMVILVILLFWMVQLEGRRAHEAMSHKDIVGRMLGSWPREQCWGVWSIGEMRHKELDRQVFWHYHTNRATTRRLCTNWMRPGSNIEASKAELGTLVTTIHSYQIKVLSSLVSQSEAFDHGGVRRGGADIFN